MKKLRVISVNSEHLINTILRKSAAHIGVDFLQALIVDLAAAIEASCVFITRANDFPTTRVSVLATTLPGGQTEFLLTGTPCEAVFQGQRVAIEEGVCKLFEPTRKSGFESYYGIPFIGGKDHCIGHLGIFFSTPTKVDESVNILLDVLSLRMSAELQRLEIETQLHSSQRRQSIHNSILQMAAAHGPLDAVLEQLIGAIEEEYPDLLCTLMLSDPAGEFLLIGAAPGLPPEYSLAIHSVPISPTAGSCGAAAYSGDRVIARDLRTHPLWENYREVAEQHGLRSCWSQPVKDNTGRLIGVFSIYSHQPSEPLPAHIELLESTSGLLALILSHYETLDLLKSRTRKYQLFLQTATDGLVVVDMDGNFVEISNGFLSMTGCRREDLNSTCFWQWDALLDESAYRTILQSLAEHAKVFETELRHKNGSLISVEINASRFRVDGQSLTWLSARDITERKKAAAEIWRRANFDNLTGIPNRQLFQDRLEQEILKVARGGNSLALLFIDLDSFKGVNDRLGHQAGDQLLIEAAKRIQSCVRDADTVARMGGDEFTVILSELNSLEHADRVCQAIIDTLSNSFDLNGTLSRLSASIGIAFYPQHAGSSEELMKHADQAMYVAKQAGRARYVRFSNERG